MFSAIRYLPILAGLLFPAIVEAQTPIRLRESFANDYQYHVSSRAELTGSLRLPNDMVKDRGPKALALTGSTVVEYDEKVLDADAQEVRKTVRIYNRMDYRRKVGEQVQDSQLRPEIRRMVLLHAGKNEVPFSPDGPLLFSEIDMVRTEIFTPLLTGLLPSGEVREGDQWFAATAAVLKLTDLEELTSGQLACKLQEIATRDGRRYARVGLSGTVSGTNNDGPNRQQLDGYFFFDLQSNHLSYLYLNGTSWMLDKDGKEVGKVEGRFVLTRRLDAASELRAEALRGVALDPTPENSQLLFHEPGMGVRFIYPRRWTVRQADARQITLDEPGGGGLLITLEPATQTPTVRQFQAEVVSFLTKQAAKVRRTEGPEELRGAAGNLDHFWYDVELDKQSVLLDYYLSKQPAGGATFAGRYPVKEVLELRKDAERIARSLQLIPPKQ